MKHLYLIRHGRQSSKLCNVDVSLDKAGKTQAELLAQRLRGYDIDRLYCSDLKRAMETAEILGRKVGLVPQCISAFREIDFGDLTGKTNAEIAERYSEFQQERTRMTSDLAYPGGENGADVIARAWGPFCKLCEVPGQRIAIVMHGGVIRALCAHIMETDMRYKLKVSVDLENTSITEICYDDTSGRMYLERLNDYAHLEGYPELLRKGWKSSLITEK